MANFGTSLLGPENWGYVSNDVCDDGPKIWSEKWKNWLESLHFTG
jgi:hypothetical protein